MGEQATVKPWPHYSPWLSQHTQGIRGGSQPGPPFPSAEPSTHSSFLNWATASRQKPFPLCGEARPLGE